MDYGDTRLPERFWAKVYPEPNTGCWLWGASTDRRGYGQWMRVSKNTPSRPHRDTLMLVAGIPLEGKNSACHSCDMSGCCNPDHLYWGTALDNAKDYVARQHVPATHCKHGHPLSGDNLYINKTSGQRTCRACRRQWDVRRYHG